MIYTEYRITNLAELLEVAQAIHNEAIADRGENVDPSEILIESPNWRHVGFTAKSDLLSDNSTVYNVTVDAQ